MKDWKCLIDFPTPSDLAKTKPSKPNPNPPSSSIKETIIPTTNIPSKTLGNIESTTDNNKNAPLTHQKQTKSFAQAVSNLCDIPSSQLPQRVLKGDNFSISIPEEEYLVGLETCKYNLHARIIWPKGSSPLTVQALCSKLLVLWKDLSL